MKSYKIACISGDGIGKEVAPAGQTVLAALAAASKRARPASNARSARRNST